MSDRPTPPADREVEGGDIVPNANSPQLLTHLLERVARGVRSSRGLTEALGVDPRTVRYYIQAGTWLGFLVEGPEPTLSADGLAYVYGGADRPAIYARVVAAQPQLAELMALAASSVGRVTDASVATTILRMDPDLAPSTVARRVSALRGLLGPCLEAGAGRRLADDAGQLTLPLAQPPRLEPPPTTKLSGRSFSPDVYRWLLTYLLDHGELSLGHLRGLLDQIGAADVPIGSYVELAMSRGDASRLDERLIVSAGAVARRDVVDSTAGIVLSDGAWRAHLEQVRRRATGDSDRWRPWDRRLFGRDADRATLDADLQRVVRDRDLASWPRAVGPAPVQAPAGAIPFLDAWQASELVVALPPSLVAMWEGVAGVNRHLRNARHRTDAVGAPTVAYRPLVVHGGLLHPGEVLPRAVADLRSLRIRAVRCSPFLAMATALLLAHRTSELAPELHADQGAWGVRRGRARWGELLDVCEAFGRTRGWLVSRRVRGGLDGRTVVSLLERLGIAVIVDDRVVLDDALFRALRQEDDESVLREPLSRLAEAMGEFLAGYGPAGARAVIERRQDGQTLLGSDA